MSAARHCCSKTRIPYLHYAVRREPDTPVIVGQVRVEIDLHVISLRIKERKKREQRRATEVWLPHENPKHDKQHGVANSAPGLFLRTITLHPPQGKHRRQQLRTLIVAFLVRTTPSSRSPCGHVPCEGSSGKRTSHIQAMRGTIQPATSKLNPLSKLKCIDSSAYLFDTIDMLPCCAVFVCTGGIL